jgi:hypothetical protein
MQKKNDLIFPAQMTIIFPKENAKDIARFIQDAVNEHKSSTAIIHFTPADSGSLKAVLFKHSKKFMRDNKEFTLYHRHSE